MIHFSDRSDAGRRLGEAVAALDLPAPVVLGLPRGGVPVASAVAEACDAPLDVLVVRKVGAPGNPEFAVGAIGEGGVEHLSATTLERLGLSRDDLAGTIAEERTELQRRVVRYRGQEPMIDVRDRVVVLVDDGLATGASARAAAEVLRDLGPDRIVLAVPVAPPASAERFADVVDDLLALATPAGFMAVGSYYDDFGQVTDQEVTDVLAAHR